MSYLTVGIDGSAGSGRALDWAAAQAARAGYALEVVHAVDAPHPTGIYGRARLNPVIVTDLQKYSQDLLDAAAEQVAHIAPEVKVSTRSERGPAASVLVEASYGASAIVVGSRGLGAFEAFVGSVSNKVAARARCPVFVIPDHGIEPPADGPIVVGVDGSDFSVAALRFALAEARLRDTSVRAVTACQLPVVAMPLVPEEIARFQVAEHEAALAMLQQQIGRAQSGDAEDVKVESVVIEAPTVDSILESADDAQLIVVGSHGHNLNTQMILGTVSRRLLHQTDRPVAVIGLHRSPE